MTPAELRTARQSLRTASGDRISVAKMAPLLGYHVPESGRVQLHRMETGKKKIMPAPILLMKAYLSGYRPDDGSWPE